MKIGHLIKLTLTTDIISCIIVLFLGTITDDLGMGLYAGLLTFGNILLPTLGAVLIFLSIKKKLTLASAIPSIILQAIILIAIYTLGLFVWAAIDAILYDTLKVLEGPILNLYRLSFLKEM